jgi:recA bacterial DNA recombination protein
MEPLSLARDPAQWRIPAPRRLGAAVDALALAAAFARPAWSAPAGPRIRTGLPLLDRLLEGGIARGQLTELVGPRTSGRTRVVLGTLAGVTAAGGWAALVDGPDGLDPASAAGLGIALDRLLWVRCGGRLDVAWRAADLLVRSGGFPLVAVDLGDLPPWTLGRIPSAVFVRLQRAVERAPTGLLIAAPRRVAGSLAAVAVALVPQRIRWAPGGPSLLAGLEVDARLVRSRTRAPGAGVRLAWTLLESDRAGARAAGALAPAPAVGAS